ncbi:hypothetical protein [Sphingomonas sp. CFBP 13733]|uniref:hypothetical protein n=1 Tax=Sphingomonas sp. CFBP 13733 TaxID=2775291 RepID=UPI001786D0E6|nr:hypothetical protein [Sphingomonas sp. CFBP 13733]MBD8640238.1 hypothetical protein [Sphingomonas sp. CFBP 13733]
MNSWVWAQGAGTAFAGALAYLGARLGARSGKANADKAIFVQHVTAERAVWRGAMRDLVVDLTAELRRGAVSPARPVNWRKVYAARAGIVLRLNPACREAGSPGDRHELDRRLFQALQDLISARHHPRPEWLVRADAVEEAAQRLIKKEWERAKDEARSGRLDG